MLTQQYLKECLDYNPETGVFTWKERPLHHFKRESNGKGWNTRYAGNQAGCTDGKGYLTIAVDGKLHRAHRLAFLFMEGRMPDGEVDHLNHVRDDNRWVNLRETTASGNRVNQRLSSVSTCGHTGVYFSRARRKWIAQIKRFGQVRYLGCFDEIEDAVAARKQAELELGFHPNHGQPLETNYVAHS